MAGPPLETYSQGGLQWMLYLLEPLRGSQKEHYTGPLHVASWASPLPGGGAPVANQGHTVWPSAMQPQHGQSPTLSPLTALPRFKGSDGDLLCLTGVLESLYKERLWDGRNDHGHSWQMQWVPMYMCVEFWKLIPVGHASDWSVRIPFCCVLTLLCSGKKKKKCMKR